LTVTAVEKTKRGRFSIFADGQFLFSVHEQTYLSTELAVGAEISGQRLEEIRALDEYASAKEKALSLLSYCDNTFYMLVQKLRKDFSEEASVAAAERMCQLGLVDDESYARRMASDMLRIRGYSLQRIKNALLTRGIARETAEQALAELEGSWEDDEEQKALEAFFEKRLGKGFDKKTLDKAVASALRKGYPHDKIRSALSGIYEQQEEFFE